MTTKRQRQENFASLPADAQKSAFAKLGAEGKLFKTSKKTGKRSAKLGTIPKKKVARKVAKKVAKKTTKKR